MDVHASRLHGERATVVFLTHLSNGRAVDRRMEDDDGHWVAVTHTLETGQITQYDSLGGTNEWRRLTEASEDIQLQWMLVNFLGNNRTNVRLFTQTSNLASDGY